jgi:predicted metalloenzyme YecM
MDTTHPIQHSIPLLAQSNLEAFFKDLSTFSKKHQIEAYLQLPIDHIAIKVRSPQLYEQCIEGLKPYVNSFRAIVEGGRHIAIGHLTEPLPLLNYGQTAFLEIMEPRPHLVGLDIVCIDHIEIVHPDLIALQKELEALQLTLKKETTEYHETLVLVINDAGQEVKFCNKFIGDTLIAEAKDGLVYDLPLEPTPLISNPT